MIVCSHYLILKGSKALSQLLSPSEKPAGDNKRPTSYTQNRGVGAHGGQLVLLDFALSGTKGTNLSNVVLL